MANTKYKFQGFLHSSSPDPVFLTLGEGEDQKTYGVGDEVSLSAAERDRLSNYVALVDPNDEVVSANPDAAASTPVATSAVDATVSDATTADAGASKSDAKKS